MSKASQPTFMKKVRLYLRLAGLVYPLRRATGNPAAEQAIAARVDAIHKELGHG